MSKEMIISSSAHETRVAILEDDQVAEIFIERERQRGVVGNVYKGRVSKVLPGMQSAFVDLGLERDGFLYVTDVVATFEEFDRLDTDDDDPPSSSTMAGQAPPSPALANGTPASAGQGASSPGGTPLVTPSGAHVRISHGGRGDGGRRDRDREKGPEPKIEDLLKEGQEVIVQVAKEPLGTKGARLTSHATMPGRFLVFMPTVDHVGVSRKIDSRDERSRLRGIVREFREQTGFTGGLIIRTAASGRPKEDIVSDLSYFHRVWTDVRQKAETSRAPAVVYQEQSLVAKLLRDLLTDDYSAIRIDNALEYRRVLELIERIMPSLAPKVKLYEKEFPIFEEYGVQAEIDKALRSKVWLKSGGYIVINQTEALVAIDINTGRYTGDRRLEDTITRINLEAVEEIVHQIRLRDLGGIIVIDFIDMEERRNQQKVFAALEQALRKDRSPTKSVQINEFGLVVLTRKRVKRSLERVLCRPCPHCQGSSWVKSPTTVAFEIVDQVRKSLNEFPKGLTVRVHPEVARALKGKEAPVIEELKSMVKQEVDVRADSNMYEEQYELVARK